MEGKKDKTRKKDRRDDDDGYRKEKSKRARTRSRSPEKTRDRDSRKKRRHSSSKSPDRSEKKERQRDAPPNETEVKSEAPVRKNKETDMLNTRTGGAYIPPARLRMMQAQITDKSSVAFQRLAWEALKKSIHGHINKVNVGNIGIIIKQLLKENIVRGRGLLCRSVIQAQAASPTFTNVYAALVAAVNSRFPNIGELLLKRLVIQFKRGFKRNDKAICISSASFIAHLVNQRVAHEILALELLTLLVETPTDDSVEVAIAFLKECGQKLTEVSSKGVNAIFEMLRNILHEGQLDKRVQYMIEVMFQVWKDGFKDHPALLEELELVPEEEQFTHLLMLDDATDPQDILNVFKLDDKYEENEQKYTTLSKEILGSDAETDEEGSGESGSEESDDEEGEEAEGVQKGMTIIDNTETNLVALRRTIYLTINSSLDFEECAHKLMKMQLKPGQEVELCHMFLDCCAEQRTYEKFYGLLAQRFCNINRMYIGPFEQIFKDSYSTAHRLDTNRLRNVSKFFAHLLFTDSIGWEVLECVKLNEEDTTSSSRIYIKILFQELAEYMGLKKLNDRLKDPTLQEAFSGVFPRDNPKNTRFSINFFTSIGLGGLTDELREHLKQMPKNVPPQNLEINVDSSSDSSSSSSDSSSSSSSDSSSSDSEEESGKEKGEKSKKTKKTKDMTPKTPEEAAPEKDTERWGHDGFYDTYGKDARRIEPRPQRNERDKDNFAIPRDVRRNDNQGKRDDFRSQDNFRGDRRRDEYRPEDRRDTRDRSDFRRRDVEDRHGESNYRRNEDRDRDRSDADRSRDRIDDDRRKEKSYDDKREKSDDKRGSDDDHRRKERNIDDRRGNDDVYRKKERNNDRSNKSDRDRRDRHDDSRQDRYDDRNIRETSHSGENSDDSKFRRERDYRERDDDVRRDNDENNKRNNNNNSDQGRRHREEPIEKHSSRDKKQAEYDKSIKENSKNRKDYTESSEIEQNKRTSDKRRGKDKSESNDEEDRTKKNKKKKDSKREADTGDEESSKSKKDKRSKDKEVITDDTDSEEDRSNKKKKNKSKSKNHQDDNSTDGEQQEKENKHKRDKYRREGNDERSRKRDKDKKKSAEDEEGWDIRRASSLRREMPERYWKD